MKERVAVIMKDMSIEMVDVDVALASLSKCATGRPLPHPEGSSERRLFDALLECLLEIPKKTRRAATWRIGKAAWLRIVELHDDDGDFLAQPGLDVGCQPTLLAKAVDRIDGDAIEIVDADGGVVGSVFLRNFYAE